ncbi:unnamed protein product [Urochloa humidicola]
MLVRCDVCGVEPAAVLCCADEAALCSGCDRSVHRANKLADKHHRIPLHHPSGSGDSSAAAPLCDVCKERRGLVFCVEDRAILCGDCDEPIHSANHLTAKHNRFLLVGAKLSAAAFLDHQPPPSPDDDCAPGNGAGEPHAVSAAAIPAQGSCPPKSSAPDCSNGGGISSGSSISDYLTNICPGWRVDDLLFDDAVDLIAGKQQHKGGCGEENEEVPCLDADLFDVVAGRPGKRGSGAWYGGGGGDLDLETKVPDDASMAVPMAAAKQQHGRVRERHYWTSCDSDSDVFAVPEIAQQPPPAKKARPAPATSFWCF